MIDTAVLLAAGMGSRLRDAAPFKPLCPVAGKPLIDHALDGLAAAGIARAVVVLGYGAAAILDHLAVRGSPIPVATVLTDPVRPNGVSALAARPWLGGGAFDRQGALLAMCDHLVDPALYTRVAAAGAGDGLRLGIDRRLGHPWIDPLDVTCVATANDDRAGDRIVAIGKEMAPHDCYDTGVFAVGSRLFDALAALSDPSLTEGVRALAAQGAARVVDCSDIDWIDVDDAAALAHAEAWLADRSQPRVA